MVPFIDVHCHLDYTPLKEKLDSVIENARLADVKVIVTNSVDKKTIRLSLGLAKKYDIVKPALGYYPPDALHVELEGKEKFEFNYKEFEEELEFIKKHKNQVVAIGEIGLDYKNGKDKELQKRVFVAQIRLAKEIDKPVIVHSRNAEEDVLNVLDEEKAKKVVLHCFSGKKQLVERAIKLGFYFSIPTNVVRSESIQWLTKTASLSKLFAETDSPFLSPFKEKHNEPAYVIESYKKIAEIKGMTIEEVKNNLFLNWQRLFN
jgi:TatD DNase family protein